MIQRLHLILFSLCFFFLPIQLSAQAMRCELYTIDSEGLKHDRSIFDFLSHSSKDIVFVELADPNKYHPPIGEWEVVWQSTNGLRIVAIYIENLEAEDFRSPANMIDVDYSRLRFAWRTAGGVIDLDTVIYSPWKQHCHRLD